jgi:hypothetical protein
MPPASPKADKASPPPASTLVHGRTHGLVCFTVAISQELPFDRNPNSVVISNSSQVIGRGRLWSRTCLFTSAGSSRRRDRPQRAYLRMANQLPAIQVPGDRGQYGKRHLLRWRHGDRNRCDSGHQGDREQHPADPDHRSRKPGSVRRRRQLDQQRHVPAPVRLSACPASTPPPGSTFQSGSLAAMAGHEGVQEFHRAVTSARRAEQPQQTRIVMHHNVIGDPKSGVQQKDSCMVTIPKCV